MNRLLVLITASLVLGGCAIGNQYSYQSADIALPVTGAGEVGLAVIDRRPYVVSGDKGANFVGLQRGGFGNPFNVTTESGLPLAQVVQDELDDALTVRGFQVQNLVLKTDDMAVIASAFHKNGAPKNIVLIFYEWKTDAMMSFGLSYDLQLKILNQSGNVIAETSTKGNKESLGGAGFESHNSTSAAQALELKLSRMFNEPEVKAALEM